VERVLLAERQALGLLVGREDRVDVADRVELELLLLVRRLLRGEVARLVEPADLLVRRDQRRIADDARIDRRLDLAVGQDLALQRRVVVDQRDAEPVVELGARDRVGRRDASAPRSDDALYLAEPRIDIFGFFVPKHLLSCRITATRRTEGVYETESGSSRKPLGLLHMNCVCT
jgi:hypothetical protein